MARSSFRTRERRSRSAAYRKQVSTDTRLDVVGIGNAIVDVIAHADEAFLTANDMAKGTMVLIDEARAEALYASMAPAVIASGGSVGNTIAGIASLGGKTGYIGKVGDDVLGRAFRHDITAVGVDFRTEPLRSGPATARCLILVTPDAQRTMNTYLGACADLGPDDVDADLIRDAELTLLEGYLYDPPLAQQAFHLASDIAHAAGRKVGLSLSDLFCVERHRAEFAELVERHVDVLFGNEIEVTALFETRRIEEAVERLRTRTDVAAITLGAKGSLVVTRDEVVEIPAVRHGDVVDTTGAGDLYAAGFLYGLARKLPLPECGRLGSLAAAEIISHVGARPQTSLKDFVATARA